MPPAAAAAVPTTKPAPQHHAAPPPAATYRGPSQQTIARWSAVTVPLMIVAVVSWASYVVVGKLAVARLINRSEHGAGIAVIVVYCVLLFATAVAYLRILVTIRVNPGLVALGRGSADERRRRKKGGRRPHGVGHHRHGRRERRKFGGGKQQHHLGDGGVFEDEEGRTWADRQYEEKLKRLEKYVPREVFVCDYDGLPLWCDKCSNWKPDRTHHCSDLWRCVRRMDHFCPWVGGIVSETTMKFFIQFTFYGTLQGLFIIITDAILFARDQQNGHHIDSHMAVLLGFAGLFTLFAVGIFGNTFFMTLRNLTTVEALNRGNATYHMSVLITPSWCNRRNDEQYPFRTTTYPGAPGALYAILLTRPGDNPWDLGTLKNWKSVMGNSIVDWFLPLKYSPAQTMTDRIRSLSLARSWRRSRGRLRAINTYPSSIGIHIVNSEKGPRTFASFLAHAFSVLGLFGRVSSSEL
ncbi:DHHC palmitoyltransferase-domain-containing protein [Macrophomina phaseolina]|uniref:Palmitoyltransferase n=1 Tax=Macrophomina phaseolina TaxID=35725 RepID=A0ABQ8GS09_9PEZI|nr:DHHC palmitoyltransferase-domain-containing protein [Macrophomina phaseolina]